MHGKTFKGENVTAIIMVFNHKIIITEKIKLVVILNLFATVSAKTVIKHFSR